MALPKWTEERTEELTNFVGDESPISQATVAEAADQLETSTRSVSSKLRKMGFEVELASAASTRTFSEDQEATLATLFKITAVSILMLKLLKTSKAELFPLNQSKERFFLWN